MAKDLKKQNQGKQTARPSPLARALSRFRERQNAIKERDQQAQAELMTFTQAGQTLLEHFICGRTDMPFHIVWHRPHEHEKFKVRAMVKDSNTGTQMPNDDTTPPQVFPAEEFNFAGTYCPCCGSHLGFVYCSCGQGVCGSGRFMRDGKEHFKHSKCGAEFELGTPARVISGHAPSPTGTALTATPGTMLPRTR